MLFVWIVLCLLCLFYVYLRPINIHYGKIDVKYAYVI